MFLYMKYTLVGLGNPGGEYARTRHNAGRMALELLHKKYDFPDWRLDKKASALVSSHEIEGHKVSLVLPETFMNKSGSAVGKFVTSVKAAERMVVVHDELDLPLGKIKIVFGRGAGGHKGVESIMRAIKTKNFARIRIGVSPHTPAGKIRKVQGDDDVVDFVVGGFKPKEQDELKKVLKTVEKALVTIVTDGHERAMGEFN
jgi:PTH1 family peptidyl-tRNA hydrolase